MIIKSIKDLERINYDMDEKEREGMERAFKRGAWFFTPDELEKRDWIIKEGVLEIFEGMEKRGIRDNLLIPNCIVGKKIGRIVFTHHWSENIRDAPFDIVAKLDSGRELAFDVKPVSGTPPRVNIMPKWGIMPPIAKKVHDCRKRGMIPFYAFPNQNRQENSSNFFIYPLTTNDYLANLRSNPYYNKLARLSHLIEEILIYRDREEYELFKRFNKIPPELIDKKPIFDRV